MRIFKVIFILFFCITSYSAILNRSTLSIQVKRLSYISPGDVYVKDLARIDGGHSVERQAIGQLVLMTGLRRGEVKEISNIDFTRLLKIAMKKAELKISSRLNLKIPSKINFQMEMEAISSQIVRAQLYEELKRRCSSCEYEINRIDISKIQERNVTRWKIKLNQQRLRGRVSLPIETWRGGKRRLFWIPVEIASYRQVPVLQREVSLHEPLREEDFTYKRKEITRYKHGIPHISQLVGAKLKRRMSAQSVIWLKDLVREKAINRGQLVDVGIRDNLMKVELRALAKQGGYVGDVIQLENIKTKKKLSGKIVSQGKVEIQ